MEVEGPVSLGNLETWSEESLSHQIVEQLVQQSEGDISIANTEEGRIRYEIKSPKADKSGSLGSRFV